MLKPRSISFDAVQRVGSTPQRKSPTNGCQLLSETSGQVRNGIIRLVALKTENVITESKKIACNQEDEVVKHRPSAVFYLPFSLGVCSVEDSVDLTCFGSRKSNTVRCVAPCLSTFLVLNWLTASSIFIHFYLVREFRADSRAIVHIAPCA